MPRVGTALDGHKANMGPQSARILTPFSGIDGGGELISPRFCQDRRGVLNPPVAQEFRLNNTRSNSHVSNLFSKRKRVLAGRQPS